MNKVILLGRLTANPELKYTNGNTAFLRFIIAINRRFTDDNGNRQADFINIIAWKKQAETIAKFFNKGSQIGITGRIQTGSYEDDKGNKRYTTDIILEEFYFVDSKKENSESTNEPSPYDYQNNNVSVENDPFAEYGESVQIPDDFLD